MFCILNKKKDAMPAHVMEKDDNISFNIIEPADLNRLGLPSLNLHLCVSCIYFDETMHITDVATFTWNAKCDSMQH